MNRKLKIDNYNNVWVGSDFHIHHNKPFIYEKRGFKNVGEMDRWIIEDVNSLVSQDDILIYLGDGMLNASRDDDFLKWYGRINCKKIYWIFGNHCGPDYNYYKLYLKNDNFFSRLIDAEVYPITIGNITFLGNYAEISVDNQSAIISHFPFSVWNKSHHGYWNLSGHSHGSNSETLPKANKAGKVLDCGVEVAINHWKHSIFSWDEIKKIMNGKPITFIDHHHEKTT